MLRGIPSELPLKSRKDKGRRDNMCLKACRCERAPRMAPKMLAILTRRRTLAVHRADTAHTCSFCAIARQEMSVDDVFGEAC